MAKKKKEQEAEDTNVKTKVSDKPTATTDVKEQTEVSVKKEKEPQMVTVNGDKVTHAHVFKSKSSEDWFFTAKINGIPLHPKIASKEDCDAILSKTADLQTLMEKYYPTKVMPRVSDEAFKIPCVMKGANGENLTVHKFNVYKEKTLDSKDYGKYKFYAQIGDEKMSTMAKSEDLDAYFDKVKTPQQLCAKVFGDRLHLAEYYEQFKLPEGIEPGNVHIQKNKATNKYEISIVLDNIRTVPQDLSYNDRFAYFSTKTASKEQLAAKCFASSIPSLLKQNVEKGLAKEQTKSHSY